MIRPVAWRRSLLLESFGDAAGGLDGAVFRFAGADSLERTWLSLREAAMITVVGRFAVGRRWTQSLGKAFPRFFEGV
ncbi:MAG TPA: hypothetical protein DIT13_10680 [Verrucomicrobiales bacterium]|nr:hypothetical protein [Verrucomicrobiales bacterium]